MNPFHPLKIFRQPVFVPQTQLFSTYRAVYFAVDFSGTALPHKGMQTLLPTKSVMLPATTEPYKTTAFFFLKCTTQ